MKCPACEKEFVPLSDIPELNLYRYGGSVRVRTACCKQLVIMRAVRSFVVTEYIGNETEDDWGD